MVDLRHNSGGDSKLLGPLIHCISSLKKIKQARWSLHVGRVAGPFLPALMNAQQLREQTKAILVGEPTGGKPNAFRRSAFPGAARYGSDGFLFSTKYFKLSSLDTESFVPDHIVELSFADYKNGNLILPGSLFSEMKNPLCGGFSMGSKMGGRISEAVAIQLYLAADDPDKVIIFNSYTTALVEAGRLFASVLDLPHIDYESLAPAVKAFVDGLRTGGFVLDDEIDESKLLKLSWDSARYNPSTLVLTIAPTLQCNYECVYCYERSPEGRGSRRFPGGCLRKCRISS